MEKPVIYHNPRCSKSRQALDLLNQTGIEPTIIDYVKNPLTLEELQTLRAHFDIKDFVRTNEKIFKEQKLSLIDENQLLHTMCQEPKLLQRPIVTYKGRAVIGRPPEKVLDLFS